MKISEFCPKDCLRLNEEDPLQHQGCWLLEAVKLPNPYIAIFLGREVTVVGYAGNNAFIEETMSNGEISRGTVDRYSLKRS